jgi:hypothetical protein
VTAAREVVERKAVELALLAQRGHWRELRAELGQVLEPLDADAIARAFRLVVEAEAKAAQS